MRVRHAGRPRKSQYDPYLEDIKEMLESGLSYSQISEEMYDRFDIDVEPVTIGYFIKSRGLRSIVTRGKNDGRVFIPKCKECECLTEVQTTKKTGYWLMCKKMKRIISRTCQTSPMDCPLREKGSIYEVQRD